MEDSRHARADGFSRDSPARDPVIEIDLGFECIAIEEDEGQRKRDLVSVRTGELDRPVCTARVRAIALRSRVAQTRRTA